MTLSIRNKPYIIPEYSLTGDLLAYLTCGLQYRYQNKATLPPAMPVQLWFGNFIHGVMEEAYLRWNEKDWKNFPWDYKTRIRSVEQEINKRMRSRGLNPPPNLFCSFDEESDNPGLCPDGHHPHQLVASIRAEKAINTWGPHLFPLIDDAEVKLKGIRDMPHYKPGKSRSNYYSVTGIVDVLSSVQVEQASEKNLIIQYLHHDSQFKKKLQNLDENTYEIIVDYKGMNRPVPGSPAWIHHHWQVQTYAWLRSLQPSSKPVLVGILFYLNELQRFKKDLEELKGEVKRKETDIMPTGDDLKLILKWNTKKTPPTLSDAYHNLRSIRIIPTEHKSLTDSLKAFDQVVGEIEENIYQEVGGHSIQNSWDPKPERRTCDACDYQTFCSNPAGGNEPTVP